MNKSVTLAYMQILLAKTALMIGEDKYVLNVKKKERKILAFALQYAYDKMKEDLA